MGSKMCADPRIFHAQNPSLILAQGVAEELPFANNAFDLAMGVLTLHHWTDWERGPDEAARVAGGNVSPLTW